MAGGKAEDVLRSNQAAAAKLVKHVGDVRARKVLANAQDELEERLRAMPAGTSTFTRVQADAALAQVKHVARGLIPKVRGAIVGGAEDGADLAGAGVVRYLNAADEEFSGVAETSLALDEAMVMDAAATGARASVLRRLSSSGTDAPGAEATPRRAKVGILQRYGMNVVQDFEDTIQSGLLAKTSFADMRARIIEKSAFLQGKPAFWATRIVRTEVQGALNSANFEANREADEQLGDVCKILSAIFDDRTGADSYATHGQIRRPEEPFDTWYGPMLYPPDRPNDRGMFVTHRVSWPLPPYLLPKDPALIAARWAAERRSGKMPPIPMRSTIDVSLFGQAPPPRTRAVEAREAFGPAGAGDDD